MTEEKINFKCPYQNFSCTELDTSGMNQLKPCSECKNFTELNQTN